MRMNQACVGMLLSQIFREKCKYTFFKVGGMGMIPVYLLGVPESYWVVVVVLGGRGVVFLPA